MGLCSGATSAVAVTVKAQHENKENIEQGEIRYLCAFFIIIESVD